MITHPRPTPEEIRRAQNVTLADVIAPGLSVLFCGINPGLYSGAVGWHFARPGNRFWPALHAAGFTPRLLHPAEQLALLGWGYGITNIVERATAGAAELTAEELAAGGGRLAARVREYAPRILAILGISAYRAAFQQPHAVLGRQPEPIGATELWVLPNPSGLNAHYGREALADCFREVRERAEVLINL